MSIFPVESSEPGDLSSGLCFVPAVAPSRSPSPRGSARVAIPGL